MADLPAAVAALTSAVDAASDLIGDTGRRRLARQVDEVSRRQGFLGRTVVAVLAGGTGSGKSTLLNVLAGDEVVDVGVLRPTTEAPTAWVPDGADPNLLALLDDLGIERRVGGSGIDELAVVDLPDMDSVELAHHATVDALLPRADVIVWVLDPLKYNDRSLHARIAARSGYARQSLFVLNQTDRLEHEEVEQVVADLRRSLRNDGIREPDVVLIAAAPPDEEPRGIEVLQQRLAHRARDKRLVIDRLTTTLRSVADELEHAVSPADADGPALTRTWETARDEAAEAVARSIIGDVAVARAEHAGARAASAAGSGPLGRTWHALRRSIVGRALGLPGDAPLRIEHLSSPDRRLTADRAAVAVHRAVTVVSTGIGGEGGRRLRAELDPDAISTQVAGATEAAQAAEAGPHTSSEDDQRLERAVPRRAWWLAAGVLQTLLALAIVAGLSWWWIDPSAVSPGQVPWPLVLVLGGLVATMVVARLVRSSGRAAGRRFVLDRRRALTAAVGAGLEERIGVRLKGPIADLARVEEHLRTARRAL